MPISITIYAIFSFLLLLFITIASYKLDLVDFPNKRKKHSKPVANTGGLALSVTFIFSIMLFDIRIQDLNIILSISFLISIVGLIDDRYNLNTGGKLSLQIIPIVYLIIIENLNLNDIGDYYYFKTQLNSFSIPFTLLSVLLLINSFNYFDGLDGSLSSVSISILIILYFQISDEYMKLYLLTIAIPICVFLLFNFSFLNLPKAFLGDSGSLLLGTIIAFTLIYFAKQNILHPILLAWSISIFVYEFLSINILRVINHKNVFEPGLDHLHHILHKKTNSILLTNFLLIIINILFFFIGYLSFYLLNPLSSLIFFIIVFVNFFMLRKISYVSSKEIK